MKAPSRKQWILIALALVLLVFWLIWRKTGRYLASIATTLGFFIGLGLVVSNPATWIHWIIVGIFAGMIAFWRWLWGDQTTGSGSDATDGLEDLLPASRGGAGPG